MIDAEPQPLTLSSTDGPDEPEAVLCLGGPLHGKKRIWREDGFDYQVPGEFQTHHYRWVKLALTDGENAVQKRLFIHDWQG